MSDSPFYWPESSTLLLEVRELAFLGDGLFELMVRQWLLTASPAVGPKRLHLVSSQWVCHTAQAAMLDYWHSQLTDEERDWVRRGRNLPLGTTKKKNKETIAQQQQATGFEVLLGWWYVTASTRLAQFNVWLCACQPSESPKPDVKMSWPKLPAMG